MRKLIAIVALLSAIAPPAWADFWSGPGNTGVGLSQHPTSRNVFVAYYGYRVDGSPTWRIANRGDQTSTHFNGTTYTARDGQVLGGDFRQATLTEGGNIKLTFANVEQGTLQLDGGAVQALTRTVIETGRPANDPIKNYIANGWYWNSDEPGTGYHFEVQGDTIFATIFAYESNGQDVWYMATGGLVRNTSNATSSASLPLNRCTNTGTAVCTSLGTVSFQFPTNNRAVVTLPSGKVVSLNTFDF